MSTRSHPSRLAGPAPALRRRSSTAASGKSKVLPARGVAIRRGKVATPAAPSLTFGHAWGIFAGGVVAILLCVLTVIVAARIPSSLSHTEPAAAIGDPLPDEPIVALVGP